MGHCELSEGKKYTRDFISQYYYKKGLTRLDLMNRIHATVPLRIALRDLSFEAFETHAHGKLAKAISIYNFLFRT